MCTRQVVVYTTLLVFGDLSCANKSADQDSKYSACMQLVFYMAAVSD